MVNKVFLIGEVSEIICAMDPPRSNSSMFKVVTESARRDPQGKKEYKRQFHTVLAKDEIGLICSKYLHVGTPVWIEGTLEYKPDPSISDPHRTVSYVKVLVMKMMGKEILKAMEREGNGDQRSYH